MSQISKKFIADDSIDGTKIKLLNNVPMKARNAADSADVDILSLTTSDEVKIGDALIKATGDTTSLFFPSFQDHGQNVEISPQEAVAASNEDGGNMAISASNGDGSGNGGDLTGKPGDADSGNGGANNLRGGNSVTGNGGSVNLAPGKGGAGDGAVHFKNNRVDGIEVGKINNNGFQLQDQRYIRFTDNTYSVGFKGPAAYTSTILWDLPGSDGAAGEVLSTNGSGVLSWVPDANAVNKKEVFTLSAGDITNGYIDLLFEARVDSIDFVTSGLLSREGVDYSVNYTGGGGGVTRIDFSAHTPTLVATDEVRVKYQY